MMRQLTGRGVSNGIALILEGTGWVLLLGATSLRYRWLGGVLIVAGLVAWGWPEVRTSIAGLRERDARHHGSPGGKSEAVEQADAADEAQGGTRMAS